MNTTGARFTRAQRLTKSAEFSHVFAEPVRSADRYFTVLARANGRAAPRLGLAISKRVARRAVDRNRLKRLAREAFRHQDGAPGYDCVVMARPAATAAGNGELLDSLARHFERLSDKAGGRRNG